MSKKIIYLLSLLMALSLVFAGCKKASTAPTGEGPTKEDEVKPPSNLGNTGLFDTQTKLDEYKEKPIQQSTEVAKYENGNYMRNPQRCSFNRRECCKHSLCTKHWFRNKLQHYRYGRN